MNGLSVFGLQKKCAMEKKAAGPAAEEKTARPAKQIQSETVSVHPNQTNQFKNPHPVMFSPFSLEKCSLNLQFEENDRTSEHGSTGGGVAASVAE